MYETGVGVAFLIWAYATVMIWVNAQSTFERNLRKVGMRRSWSTGRPRYMTASDYTRGPLASIGKYLLIAAFGLIWIVFSWVYVLWYAATVVHAWSKDRNPPQEVRDFRWRAKNQDLSFDEMVAGIQVLTRDPRSFEDYKQSVIEAMDQVNPA